MSTPSCLPELRSGGEILAAVHGGIGLITLNRPQALNALSLAMVRDLSAVLRHWATEPRVQAVLVNGAARPGKAAAFCAGGDIRFFHQAALAGDPALDAFFTEEYTLNLLIHQYAKPYIAWMDGVVMGGGMGISQGARLRVLTEHSRLAMPETNIGLFPDVGGGHFLAACPGRVGEWLALSGDPIGASDALAFGLGDVCLPSAAGPELWSEVVRPGFADAATLMAWIRDRAAPAPPATHAALRASIDRHFSAPDLRGIVASLASDDQPWAQATHATLLKRSPLMMAVTLAQLQRGRGLSLADDLRMERDLVQHCFHPGPGQTADTLEGIRALVIDKDHRPRWNPPTIEAVTTEQVDAFFVSPWAPAAHPLAGLV